MKHCSCQFSGLIDAVLILAISYIVNDGVILAIALAKSFEPVASLDILFSLFKERALSDDQKLNNSFDGLLYFCLQVEFDNVYYVKC